jgi:hypothetical protein
LKLAVSIVLVPAPWQLEEEILYAAAGLKVTMTVKKVKNHRRRKIVLRRVT